MKFVRAWGLLGVLLLMLAACANETPTPGAVTSVPAAQSPAGSSNTTASAITTLQPAIVQTPASDQVGTVTGRLTRLQSKAPPEPLAGAPLYLGTILKNPDGQDRMVELSRDTAPKTNTDAEGRFVFTDVKPGRYGLMLDAPFGTLLLNHPQNGGDLVLDVAGGKVLDIGDLEYLLDY